MNKKADITIIILVLGIVAICIFAIITFINSNISAQNNFKKIRIIWDMNQRIESDTFSVSLHQDSSFGNYYEYSVEEKKDWAYPISSLPKILFRIRYYPDLN
ncbi:hypothetical protein DRN73_08450 [Candidatus Pacearchaeota archaeon]|nr:MAG: hypothetical protein DRN73_08450 [Candidatus Pacearchaeota archaeon]